MMVTIWLVRTLLSYIDQYRHRIGVYKRGFVNEQQFKERTKKLALRIIRLVEVLPTGITATVLGKQVLRSATSIGAN
jgi:hypothetical protein